MTIHWPHTPHSVSVQGARVNGHTNNREWGWGAANRLPAPQAHSHAVGGKDSRPPPTPASEASDFQTNTDSPAGGH